MAIATTTFPSARETRKANQHPRTDTSKQRHKHTAIDERNPTVTCDRPSDSLRRRLSSPTLHVPMSSPCRSSRTLIVLTSLAVLVGSMHGCAKKIGDPCRTSTDCSINGDRICDLTQREGYCTIPECDPNSCPDDALCVEFEAHTPRLARRYCMQPCTRDQDCRAGYVCMEATVRSPEMCPMATMPNGTPPAPCTRLLDSTCQAPAPGDGGLLRPPACRTATRFCVQSASQ